jgi:O-antigen ligase
MIDNLFVIALVLNATGIFSFFAPQLGVSIGQISLALLALNLLYLIMKVKITAAIFRQKSMKIWTLVILIWPLLTIVYAPSFEIREIGLKFYYFSLFYGAIVYTIVNGFSAMYRVMAISLGITVIGLIISLVAHEYFDAVSQLAGAEGFTKGRAFGFFLQPNRLAIDLAFLFIAWFALWKRKNSFLEVMAIMFLLLLMLLTGSRTGIIFAIFIVILIYVQSSKKRMMNLNQLFKIALLIVFIAGGSFAIKKYMENIVVVTSGQLELAMRMSNMLQYKLSDSDELKDDTSILARVAAQLIYLSLILERPFFGHGFGSNTYYLGNDTIFRAAHSDAITYAMEYGILYLVAFMLLILQLYLKGKHKDLKPVFQSNSISQFSIIFLVLNIIAGDNVHDRTLYIIWGMFFAAVYCTHLCAPITAIIKESREILPHPQNANA